MRNDRLIAVAPNVVRGDIDQATLTALTSVPHVACDIETSGLDPRRDRIGTVQIHASVVGDIVVQVSETRPTRLCKLMEDHSTRKVFHHAMFDLRFMAAHWNVTPANIACTKIASKLLKPQATNDHHSLKRLLDERLNIHIQKDQRLSDWLTPDLTSEQIKYAAADVEHLTPLLSVLEDDLRAAGLIELFYQCLSFIPTRVRLDLGQWPDVFNY
jgi:ribonuclease D